MLDVLGELLPQSLAIAINPVPIIALLLMYQGTNGRTRGVAFMAGWIGGVTAILLVTTLLAAVLPDRAPDEPAPVAGTIRIMLGLLLVGLGIAQWMRRPRGDEEPGLPSWMTAITTMGPRQSFRLSFLFTALNIKHAVIASSIGVTIGASDLSGSQEILAFVAFILLATWPVVATVVAHRLWEADFTRRTEGLYRWLVANNVTIVTILLVVIGAAIVGQGLQSF